AALSPGEPRTPRWGLAIGLVLGPAVAVSLKTIVLLPAIIAATAATLLLAPAARRPWRRILVTGAAAAAGVVVVPGCVMVYFAARGALGPLLYGTVWHNLLPGLPQANRDRLHLVALALVPIAWMAARRVARDAPTELGLRRAFLVLLTAAYAIVLLGGWPLVTRQDMLPLIPLAAIAVTALVELALAGRRLLAPLFPLAAALEIAFVLGNRSVRFAEARQAVAFEADVLSLAAPGEPVLDLKGDTVFRPRSIYWVLESITRERLRRGLVADDFAEHLAGTRTCVVAGKVDSLPPRTRGWVRFHYLPVARHPGAGSVLAAGVRFDPAHGGFEVGVPATYALVGPDGTPHGLLDDRPYEGPRRLTAGWHTYRAASDDDRVALLWSPALAR